MQQGSQLIDQHRRGLMLSDRLRRMVEDRVGLARAIAHQEWKKLTGYDRDEITSWAYQGLISAADRWPEYCVEHGFEAYEGDAQSWFDTYATRRIRGQIIDQLRAGDVATRRERKTIKEIVAKGVDLSATWAHESPESIARKTGLAEDDIRRALAALARIPVPIDDSDEVVTLASSESVETDASELALCQVFVSAVRALSASHRRVLVLALYKGQSDIEIVESMPEIGQDPLMGPYALSWVALLREQAVAPVLLALRRACSTGPDPLPLPPRVPVPAPKRRRAARTSSEPIGAVALSLLAS